MRNQSCQNIKWSMTSANADGILTDPVTVEANWNAVQGVSACNIQKGLEDKMTFFYIWALTITFKPTSWLTRWFLSTSKSNDAGSEAASSKDTSSVRHRQHAPFARRQNSSVLQLVGDRFGTSHGSDFGATRAPASTSGRRPTSQKKSIQNDA